MRSRLRYGLILLALGVGWGSTQPLGKIAASTGHGPFGLIFWQLVVCVAVLGPLTFLRGKRMDLRPEAWGFYVTVAMLGTILPNFTFYYSIARLPSGIMSIMISTIPLIAFPIALVLGMDRFSPRRVLGLMLGLAGVLMIALPEASLPDRAMVAFLPVAMIGPLFYALENTYVARVGLRGMDAVQAMFGASVVALAICVVPMLAFGHWFAMPIPPGRAEGALILSSALHAGLYATFVWLAARTGAVFASQSAYVTTVAGVAWAMAILGERFSVWIFAAVGVMLVGMTLVRPGQRRVVEKHD